MFKSNKKRLLTIQSSIMHVSSVQLMAEYTQALNANPVLTRESACNYFIPLSANVQNAVLSILKNDSIYLTMVLWIAKFVINLIAYFVNRLCVQVILQPRIFVFLYAIIIQIILRMHIKHPESSFFAKH